MHMAVRPSWDGYLRFNLISVPVKAYSATVAGGGKIGLHLLHKKCSSRIRYKKICPIHGEVDKDEIVSGYEYAKGKYVIVDPAELDKLRTENDKAITIDSFIRPDAIDPMYFSGRTYYLVPEGRVGQKPYAVLQEVMTKHERYGIAQMVFAGREQIAVVRPVKNLLTMTILLYADQIKKPTSFEEEAGHAEVSAEERRLAENLIDASTKEEFDLARYKDEYTAKLTKLIEAKAKGRKIVAAPSEEPPAVINLMDALRQSLDLAHKTGNGRGRNHGDGKKTSSRAHKASHTRARRKTG
jgi:DNA end-binding protein Ku